jgi:hypothetical protein
MSSLITIRPMSPWSALKSLSSALAIMTLVMTLGTAADQSAQAVEKLVDVGGYNLNFRIIPGQGPAILLESGGGMDSNERESLFSPSRRNGRPGGSPMND